MELVYSMRRKPLKYEPPHFENPLDTEVVRPMVTISVCNIIAFSSPTELSDAEGDTWGGHVYVCDMDTPWDSHKVVSTVHPVSALEWDNEGKNLLVGTTGGDVSVYGQKDYLLNDWTCLYTVTFPGEHIIRAIFFHNGRRVVAVDKKPDALIADKFQLLRSAPTLKGFGGAWVGGALVVTASGLVGAACPGAGAGEPLRPARLRVAAAALAHKSGGVVVAAACLGAARWVVRCAVAKPRALPHLALQPLPALHLPTPAAMPLTISWCLRDDVDCLLVAGHTLTLWKLAEGAHPVHKLLTKGPLQGSTTPTGAVKPGSDCFNTVVWQASAAWAVPEGQRAVVAGGVASPCPAPCPSPSPSPAALLATPTALHLLSADNHHICSRAVPLGSGEGPAGGTPPKKLKYGPGTAPCGSVSDACASVLGGAVVCVDTHARLHLYRLTHTRDMPNPMAIQHICSLLEYSMVSGIDCLDVLLTIKSSLVETIYDRFTESFQRQPPTFQQYYYHSWLKLRIALCRLAAPLSASAAWLCSVQMCHCAWAAALPALRADDRPDHALALALDQDQDNEKTLLALEAKPESCGDVSALGALRQPLQRALDVALTALTALQHSTHPSHGYEIWSDPAAVALLRKLTVVARACGRGGDSLSRPLARLQAPGSKHEMQEECGAAWGGGGAGARAWEGAVRCSVTAPHAAPAPLHLEYGVTPDNLRFTPEPPPYLQADMPPPRQMDTIRYMYLGGGGLPAKWRECGRCGALAAPPHTHRHPLLHATDARLMPACRCGGKWTLVSNV